MRRNIFVTGKKQAQAMVEFAIALPMLLLLLYGILEAGRLLFIYSSIVTASRQAVRYGSATGLGPNGLPRYQECAAIKQAAENADYLNAFDDTDIVITYDKGNPNTSDDFDTCDGATDIDVRESEISDNRSRIVVTINGDFLPIVPGIVPFMRRSADDSPPDPIVGVSARTILVSVDIIVTAPPSTWQAIFTPTFTATFTPSPTVVPTDTSPPSDTPTATATIAPTDTPAGPTSTATNTGTATQTATSTATGTATSTGTQIPSPTPTGTAVSQCQQITMLGNFSKSGNTMSIRIRNQNSYPVTVANVFLVWNGDAGHTANPDHTLDLQSASLGSTVFWNGLIDGASSVTIVPLSTATIPANANNLDLNFNFHQSYDNWDSPATERIVITFNQPTGCALNVLDVSR